MAQIPVGEGLLGWALWVLEGLGTGWVESEAGCWGRALVSLRGVPVPPGPGIEIAP